MEAMRLYSPGIVTRKVIKSHTLEVHLICNLFVVQVEDILFILPVRQPNNEQHLPAYQYVTCAFDECQAKDFAFPLNCVGHLLKPYQWENYVMFLPSLWDLVT